MGVKRPRRVSPSDEFAFYRTRHFIPFPSKFHMPQVEAYGELKDPLDHLESFKTLMHLQGMADEIMCRVFSTTLKGLAREWFSRLTPNSISTFKVLSAQFVSHFIGGTGRRSPLRA